MLTAKGQLHGYHIMRGWRWLNETYDVEGDLMCSLCNQLDELHSPPNEPCEDGIWTYRWVCAVCEDPLSFNSQEG